MAIEMLLNNDIQKKFYSNDFTFSKGNKCNYVHYWKKNQIKLELFNLDKISIKYEFSKFMFL
jgi:hypothetical protein